MLSSQRLKLVKKIKIRPLQAKIKQSTVRADNTPHRRRKIRERFRAKYIMSKNRGHEILSFTNNLRPS